jgi:lipoprotein-releasing system permease protein
VSVIGADPALQDAMAPVTKHLIAGRYLELSSEEIVIDAKLAADLHVATGERLRLTSSTGASDVFTIVGIYTRGQGRGDAYITLRQAQSLYGLGTSVNTIFVKLRDIFEADRVADRIMALLPYETRSWSREFPNFVSSLRAQSAVAYLTSIFSLIASSFAIASVLIVSVLQKSKQIGILKSMGARQRQILTVFILEGLGVALVGSAVGALLGTSIVYLLSLIKQPVTHMGHTPEQLFPVTVLPGYIAAAILAAIMSTVLAAWLPARRAARLNPVEVMR